MTGPGALLLRTALAAVVAATLTTSPAGAVPEQPRGAPAAAIDRGELETFVRELVSAGLQEYDVPGAVVAIVHDGEVVLARGYGHTDLERRTPVDPARTRFDIGSVTKLFTATAAMQLVERGDLDVDTDVNEYLSDLRVPDTYPQPITTAHLLTHTSGLAERLFVGMVAERPEDVGPLGDNLARHLPPRIHPPGEVHQYSNHGMALAGLVVEELSGRPFTDYVASEILEPLGMSRTTFGAPPELPAMDAVGHEDTAGPTTAVDRVYITTRPAGGLWSTGEDMTAFMLAQLNGGEYDRSRILEAATVEEMQRSQFRSHPAVSGIGYGFFELASDGRRAVQHGGGWIGFGSLLRLLPDERFGLFVAYNHGRGQQLAPALADAVIDRFFPAPAFDGEPRPGAADRAETFAGSYRWIRSDRHTFMRLVSELTTTRIDVEANGDGSLTTTMWPWRLIADARWIESEPGVFHEHGGTKTLVFDLDEDGRPTRLHVAGAQLFVMEPTPWYGRTAVTIALLAFFVAALLVAALGWPAGALYRRLRGRRAITPSALRSVRVLTGIAGILGLAFLLGLAAHFALDQVGLLSISLAFRGLLLLPVALTAVVAGSVALIVRVWLRREGATAARLYHSGIVFALVALIPFLYHFRLLGFHY